MGSQSKTYLTPLPEQGSGAGGGWQHEPHTVSGLAQFPPPGSAPSGAMPQWHWPLPFPLVSLCSPSWCQECSCRHGLESLGVGSVTTHMGSFQLPLCDS